MKHLLSLCTLMVAAALQGPAQTTVEAGKPYTLQASSQSVYLSNDGKQLRTVASLDDEPYYRTAFYFEATDAADGTYHLMTPTGKYVWKQLDGTANIMLGAKSQSSTGEELSSRKIKAMLRRLIEEEDKNAPLPDEALAAQLKEQGYPVARRTVAKYREQMGFPPARLRR